VESGWGANLIEEKASDGMFFVTSGFMQRLIWMIFLISIAFACSLEGAFYARAGAEEEKTLRISIVRSGGFAGITMRATVDEKDLAPDEALKLRQLVKEADFLHLPGKIVSRSPQPDRFQYELRLEEGGPQYAVRVSEEVMPEKLKPLINWLMEKAHQTRKGKETR
jgi:hypothetical protein